MEIRIVVPNEVYEREMKEIESIISECEENLVQYVSYKIHVYEVD